MCGAETLFNKAFDECQRLSSTEKGVAMIEKGLYYANDEFASMIKSVGGTWNDTKRRPIVCLIKSSKNPNICWAIPMGNYKHRTKEQQEEFKCI